MRTSVTSGIAYFSFITSCGVLMLFIEVSSWQLDIENSISPMYFTLILPIPQPCNLLISLKFNTCWRLYYCNIYLNWFMNYRVITCNAVTARDCSLSSAVEFCEL